VEKRLPAVVKILSTGVRDRTPYSQLFNIRGVLPG
jgi:hypothetical protein